MTMLISVAAATAVANYDLMKASEAGPYVMSNTSRRLVSAGFVGSTAISDCEVRILVGQKEVARMRNTTAGASKVPVDTDRKMINEIVPPNTPIAAVMSIAANANAVVLELDIRPVATRQWTGRRTSTSRSGNSGTFVLNGQRVYRDRSGQIRPSKF